LGKGEIDPLKRNKKGERGHERDKKDEIQTMSQKQEAAKMRL